MTKEEAIQKAHAMSAYVESEQADEKTHDFDDLWQSLYDICQLATYGIVELTQEEIGEAIKWLKDTQMLTKQDQETDIYFSEGLKNVGFAHQRYGHLDNYGAENVPVADFSKNMEQTLQTVTKAVKKVQQVWRNAYDKTRGC